MNVKRAVFAVVVGGLVLAFSISRAVVDTSQIEKVKGKSVLTPPDLQVIDEFMDDAVSDIVNATDFTEAVKARTTILNYQWDQAQYADQYSQSALRRISEGMQKVQSISNPAKRFKVLANLLILVENLKDPRLVDLAVGMIAHENNTVRYWAVRAVTDPALWAKLSQGQSDTSQLASRIIGQFGPVIDASSPETLRLMAEFAGARLEARTEGLLVGIADARIRRYADWTVKYELTDIAILKQLCNKIATAGGTGGELPRRFAQLYSFAIQRYIKGQQRGVLKSISRNYLASVIAEIEAQCLGRLLGTPQQGLVRAIQAQSLDGLGAEHDRLLGAQGQAGALVSKLGINYGSAGQSRAEPLALPDPPQRATAADTPAGPQP